MRTGYEDLTLKVMKREMEKITPICLHHKLKDWVRWVCALTLANTIVMILLHVFMYQS